MIDEYLLKSNDVTALFSERTGNYYPAEDRDGYDPELAYYVVADGNKLQINKETYNILKKELKHTFTINNLNKEASND